MHQQMDFSRQNVYRITAPARPWLLGLGPETTTNDVSVKTMAVVAKGEGGAPAAASESPFCHQAAFRAEEGAGGGLRRREGSTLSAAAYDTCVFEAQQHMTCVCSKRSSTSTTRASARFSSAWMNSIRFCTLLVACARVSSSEALNTREAAPRRVLGAGEWGLLI